MVIGYWLLVNGISYWLRKIDPEPSGLIFVTFRGCPPKGRY